MGEIHGGVRIDKYLARNDFVIRRVKIAPSIPFKPGKQARCAASNAGCVYMISRARVELHWTAVR